MNSIVLYLTNKEDINRIYYINEEKVSVVTLLEIHYIHIYKDLCVCRLTCTIH